MELDEIATTTRPGRGLRPKFPELHDPQRLAALLRGRTAKAVAAEVGCTAWLVGFQARRLGLKLRRRPDRPEGGLPAASPAAEDEEPEGWLGAWNEDFDALEAERRKVATAAADGSSVRTMFGPRDLVRIGTGQLDGRLEERARRRAERRMVGAGEGEGGR